VTARTTPRAGRNPDRKVWLLAWLLTLLLHAVGILVLQKLPSPDTAEATVRPEPIQLVFEPVDPGPRKPEAPSVFTELPPDRADEAPDRADFLSNVTSRARDRAPGGDRALPQMQAEELVPMLKLEADGSPPASLPSAAQQNDAADREPSPAQRPGTPPPGQPGKTAAGPTTPAYEGRDAKPPSPESASRDDIGAAANSDLDQPEMGPPDAGTAPTGDISLNTTAWDYAPWLQRFGRKLMHRWIPPTAYMLGILKDGGWAVFDMEISPAGKVLRLEVVEEHGHPSLAQAAQAALNSLAPVEPLPADFPEPTLILRVRMIYPKFRPRP